MEKSQSQLDQVTYIRPARGWAAIDFRELWHYRELFFVLIKRDVLVKYKQTLFGFAWAILVPVIQAVIFGTLFGQVAKVNTDGLNGYLFYLTNLSLWTFFATAFNRTSISLVQNANLLTKIYFPRLLMPASNCIAGSVDFLIALGILLILAFSMGVIPAATILAVPLLVLWVALVAFGIGLLFSALNVRFRDVSILIPFVTQIWMYCTIIFPYGDIQRKLGEHGLAQWAWVYGLNPLAGAIETFRWCLFHPYLWRHGADGKVMFDSAGKQQLLNPSAPWPLICAGLPVLILLLLLGLFYFRRTEKVFADIV